MIPARWWSVLCDKGAWPKYKGLCAELLLISEWDFFLMLSFAYVWGICLVLLKMFSSGRVTSGLCCYRQMQGFQEIEICLPPFFLSRYPNLWSVLVLGAACGSDFGSAVMTCRWVFSCHLKSCSLGLRCINNTLWACVLLPRSVPNSKS